VARAGFAHRLADRGGVGGAIEPIDEQLRALQIELERARVERVEQAPAQVEARAQHVPAPDLPQHLSEARLGVVRCSLRVDDILEHGARRAQVSHAIHQQARQLVPACGALVAARDAREMPQRSDLGIEIVAAREELDDGARARDLFRPQREHGAMRGERGRGLAQLVRQGSDAAAVHQLRLAGDARVELLERRELAHAVADGRLQARGVREHRGVFGAHRREAPQPVQRAGCVAALFVNARELAHQECEPLAVAGLLRFALERDEDRLVVSGRERDALDALARAPIVGVRGERGLISVLRAVEVFAFEAEVADAHPQLRGVCTGRRLRRAAEPLRERVPVLELACDALVAGDRGAVRTREIEGLRVGVERRREVAALLLVEAAEAHPERDLAFAARALGELRFHELDELFLAPSRGERVGELCRHVVAPRLAGERLAQLVDRHIARAARAFELRALAQRVDRRRVACELGRALQVLCERLGVAERALHVRQIQVHDRVVGEEVERAPEPLARVLRVVRAFELNAARVVSDGELLEAVLRQREAAVLQVVEGAPLLSCLGAGSQRCESGRLTRVVGERLAEVLGCARRVAEPLLQIREPRERCAALGALQTVRGLLERGCRGREVARLLRGVREAEQRRRVGGFGRERLLVTTARIRGVATLLEPERADLARELGALRRAHRQLRLGVGEREHGVPFVSLREQAAQLRDRGAQRGIERGGLAVRRDRSVAVAEPLLARL